MYKITLFSRILRRSVGSRSPVRRPLPSAGVFYGPPVLPQGLLPLKSINLIVPPCAPITLFCVRRWYSLLPPHAKDAKTRRCVAGDYTELRGLPRETRVPSPARSKNLSNKMTRCTRTAGRGGFTQLIVSRRDIAMRNEADRRKHLPPRPPVGRGQQCVAMVGSRAPGEAPEKTF